MNIEGMMIKKKNNAIIIFLEVRVVIYVPPRVVVFIVTPIINKAINMKTIKM